MGSLWVGHAERLLSPINVLILHCCAILQANLPHFPCWGFLYLLCCKVLINYILHSVTFALLTVYFTFAERITWKLKFLITSNSPLYLTSRKGHLCDKVMFKMHPQIKYKKILHLRKLVRLTHISSLLKRLSRPIYMFQTHLHMPKGSMTMYVIALFLSKYLLKIYIILTFKVTM